MTHHRSNCMCGYAFTTSSSVMASASTSFSDTVCRQLYAVQAKDQNCLQWVKAGVWSSLVTEDSQGEVFVLNRSAPRHCGDFLKTVAAQKYTVLLTECCSRVNIQVSPCFALPATLYPASGREERCRPSEPVNINPKNSNSLFWDCLYQKMRL